MVKDMTTCQQVLLKLGTTHPTSQINLVWYQSAVCVLSFKEKTTSPNWTGDDLDQPETSSHDSRVMARLPFFPLLWTNEERLRIWLLCIIWEVSDREIAWVGPTALTRGYVFTQDNIFLTLHIMNNYPGKCYHMMNVFGGKQEDVDIWIRAFKEEVELIQLLLFMFL